MNVVSSGQGGVYFVYEHGGTGKTFIWKTLSAAIRSKGDIVLTVASSDIASLLLNGGRTVHSRFAIPINVNEDSTCNITLGTDLSHLLKKSDLIIWDEAPMIHRFCVEALDKTLRDILRDNIPNSLNRSFGGKVIVFEGDFRQILLVIPKGSRADIVFSTINSSYLWSCCTVLRLSRNMRLKSNNPDADLNELKQFSEWILKVGDGCIGEENDGEAVIDIPDNILIKDTVDLIASIVDCTYPSMIDNLMDPDYFRERAILAPTHEIAKIVNEYLMSKVQGEERVYLSSDNKSNADRNILGNTDLHSPEFLNTIRYSGLPNHKLKLKVDVPVILIRNINPLDGLCNGTRLQVTRLGNHIIEAKIITERNIGHKVFIPRMILSPSNTKFPFKMQRRQFPLVICFAMTINKSQGQSLSHVGLYLPRPIFSHDQLYMAILRMKSRKGLKILICDKEGNTSNSTTNVVYKEVLQNI